MDFFRSFSIDAKTTLSGQETFAVVDQKNNIYGGADKFEDALPLLESVSEAYDSGLLGREGQNGFEIRGDIKTDAGQKATTVVGLGTHAVYGGLRKSFGSAHKKKAEALKESIAMGYAAGRADQAGLVQLVTDNLQKAQRAQVVPKR